MILKFRITFEVAGSKYNMAVFYDLLQSCYYYDGSVPIRDTHNKELFQLLTFGNLITIQ
jgi:hypothetical protein